MDFESILRNSGLDRYDRNARLYPALLCILPVFVTVMLWFPPAWTLLGGLVSVVVAFGAVYLLGQAVRYQGRAIEKKLGRRVGRAKTAALLCHADPEIPVNSKLRYHAFLRKNGITIPTAEEEQADPQSTFEAFRSAVDWLLIHTRPDAKGSGLLSENISYGFRRNMLGLKPASLVFLLATLAANAYLIWHSHDNDRIIAAIVVEVILAAVLIVWAVIIRPAFVEDASAAYAKRFLEQCEPKAPRRNTPKSAANTAPRA